MDDEELERAGVADFLAHNLVALRTALSRTQDEVATAAGLSRNHYRLLEARPSPGRLPANPRLNTVAALAAALEVGIEDLLLEPGVRTLFRWADAETNVEDRHEAVILDRLLKFSTRHLGDRAAALVAHHEGTISMGVGLIASSERTALLLTATLHQEALRQAGVRARLLEDFEFVDGLDGLVGVES